MVLTFSKIKEVQAVLVFIFTLLVGSMLVVGATLTNPIENISANENLISRTASTDTYQNEDGSYTKILYSGIRNVFEDNKWKRAEEARSLKDKGFNVVYLEKDPELIIDVIDFNYSSITYKAKGNKIGKNIPIKVYTQNQTFDEIEWLLKNPNKQLKWKDKAIKKSEKSYKFNNELEEFKETIPFGLDYYLEFGENSTVIILQDADTENLDDTFTESVDNPSFNHGKGNVVRTDSSRDWRPYIKFNIQQIPSDAVINEAYLYLFPPSTDDITTVKAFHVYNHTWKEGNGSSTDCTNEANCNGGIIHNRQPCGANFDNPQQCNLTAEFSLSTPGAGKWHIYTVTNMVRTEYVNNDNNVSIALDDQSGGSFQQVYYNSKEAANLSTRPYLNVSYTISDSTDLQILEIIPIQVVRDVDMVKDKSGIVRIVVHNNGLLDANATVNATLDGNLLNPYLGESLNKTINASKNQTFDFSFKPTQTGSRTIRAEVKVE